MPQSHPRGIRVSESRRSDDHIAYWTLVPGEPLASRSSRNAPWASLEVITVLEPSVIQIFQHPHTLSPLPFILPRQAPPALPKLTFLLLHLARCTNMRGERGRRVRNRLRFRFGVTPGFETDAKAISF